jgi:purine-binding chemotaxis protein CheW
MASEQASPVPPDVPEAPRAETVPYLGFVVGSELYGLPLSRLREVARLTRLRRIPGTPSRLAGVVNVRGELVCALDAHIILERSEEERAESGYLVALRGFDYPVGLVVDTIADIFPIDIAAIDKAPAAWPEGRRACVSGTTSVRLGFIALLDVDRMVRA